jgi:hypothetical protein
LRGLGNGVVTLDKIRSNGPSAGSQNKRSQTDQDRSFGGAGSSKREEHSRDQPGRRNSEKGGLHDPIISIFTIIAIIIIILF